MQANNKHDIGHFLGKSVDNTLKYEMLISPWNPCSAYDFKADISVGKRPFLLAQPFLKELFANLQSAKNVIAIMDGKKIDVHQILNSSVKNVIESNNRKLHSIISSIIFLGVHGIPIRGKTDDTAVFNNLLHFRVENGDEILNDHFKNSAKNANYMSHSIQNELIKSILNKIISSLQEWGLDLNKLVGQGYDGASTIAGHVSGVQKRIRDKYKKALLQVLRSCVLLGGRSHIRH
ncbi:unnamed protein product [Macrosiphum euphorbiae]|uniref:DUF4371 domain-containing protein n=1 Tax=Macrosiphum euphorbiae TaxID=13131 RepID=A0AAV0X911_9HEMI|nr:unnamed protein product [Macrosiphum euphorbiae]